MLVSSVVVEGSTLSLKSQLPSEFYSSDSLSISSILSLSFSTLIQSSLFGISKSCGFSLSSINGRFLLTGLKKTKVFTFSCSIYFTFCLSFCERPRFSNKASLQCTAESISFIYFLIGLYQLQIISLPQPLACFYALLTYQTELNYSKTFGIFDGIKHAACSLKMKLIPELVVLKPFSFLSGAFTCVPQRVTPSQPSTFHQISLQY